MSATEDTSFAFAASSFSFADEDAGARLESVTIETLPVPGTGTLRLGDSNMRAGASVTRAQIDSGTLTYLPSENGHGAAHASFSFRVSDGRDESASAYTMSIDVELTNDPATGAPLVTAPVVFRVPATLSVDLSAIEDIEGVTTIAESATYRWNRFDAGGTIVAPDIATGPTYTLATADLGMRIGVEVTFNDDEGYEESITGEAFPTTGTIRSAGACPAPIHVGGATQIWSANVGLATVSTAGISVFGYFSGSAGSLGSLDNTALNTGTGTYTVERFTVSDSGLMTIRLDKALAPDEKRTLIAHVCDRKLLFNTALVDAARNYLWDSTGLDWSDYAQRAVYVSRDTVAPTFSRISVAGRSVVLTFSEALSAASGLANSAFTVMKTAQGVEETLTPSAAPAISGAAVTLTLSEEAVMSIDTVTVSYEKPDSGSNNKLADRTDNEVEDFTTEADAPPHVVSIVRQTPSASPTNADSLTWRVTFSKDVANVDATDFAVDGTTATPTVVAVMGSSRAYDVMASGGNLADLNDTLTLAFAEAQNIADTVGSALAGTVPTGTNESTWVVDNTAPTVASIVRQDPTASPTLADELTWRVTFSEEVANVDVADFTVTGTTATLTATAVAGSSLAYDVMASGGNLSDLNGTVTLAFAEAQDIVDAVGHALATTEPTGTNDNTWMVDTTALAHCNASDAKEIWCANLTVEQFTNVGTDYLGFAKISSAGGVVPNTFAWRTAIVEVIVVSLEVGGSLTFGTQRNSGTQPSDGLLGAANFSLEIGTGAGSKTFAINNPGRQQFFTFSNQGLSWSANDSVRVKLRVVNSPATGRPSISGTADVGETLTAGQGTIADINGIPNDVAFSYQWIRVDGAANELDIPGATSKTYTLVDADEGKKVKVRMSFTDSFATGESRTSDAYPSGTIASGTPSISGTALVGETLTAGEGTITDVDGIPNDVAFSYQWIRVDGAANELDIPGATSKTYTLVDADGGKKVKVRMSFTDSAGTGESRTSDAYPEARTVLGTTFAHCNLSDPREIWCADLTVEQFTNLGTDYLGFAKIASAGGVVPNTFAWRTAIVEVIVVSLEVGGSLTFGTQRNSGTQPSDGLLGAANFSLEIGTGAGSKTFAINNPGQMSIFTFSNQGLSWSVNDLVPVKLRVVNSPATGTPSISGTAGVGETLTAGQGTIADADGIPNDVAFSYQWIRVDGAANELDIPGATSKTYTLVDADEGQKVKVRMSFTDSFATGESRTSDAYPSGTIASGTPSISGTARVGETLTAGQGTITDTDGIPNDVAFSYQWIRVDGAANELDIPGATSKTYTLVDADGGKKVKVRISFTDSLGTGESRTSDAYPEGRTVLGTALAHCNASDPKEIWCADLTVGQYAVGGIDRFGFYNTHGDGAVAPNTFTWRTVTLEPIHLAITSADLLFGIQRHSGTTPSDGMLGADNFSLEIGTGAGRKTFAINNPGQMSASMSFTFSNQGLISGTADVGETLTAGQGTIADINGIPNDVAFSYQWIRVDGVANELDIPGATSKTYTLVRRRRGAEGQGQDVVHRQRCDRRVAHEQRVSLRGPSPPASPRFPAAPVSGKR